MFIKCNHQFTTFGVSFNRDWHQLFSSCGYNAMFSFWYTVKQHMNLKCMLMHIFEWLAVECDHMLQRHKHNEPTSKIISSPIIEQPLVSTVIYLLFPSKTPFTLMYVASSGKTSTHQNAVKLVQLERQHLLSSIRNIPKTHSHTQKRNIFAPKICSCTD